MKRLRGPLIIFILICALVGSVAQVFILAKPDPLMKLIGDIQSLDNLPARLRHSDRGRSFAWAAISHRSSDLSAEHAEAIVDFMSSGISGDKYVDRFCHVVAERPALFEPVIVNTLTGRHRPPDALSAVGASVLLRSLQEIDTRYPNDPESIKSLDGIKRLQAVHEQRQSDRQGQGPK